MGGTDRPLKNGGLNGKWQMATGKPDLAIFHLNPQIAD
jgi:hypothetical protein